MNLFLHDIETFSIKRGDTLRDPRFREKYGSLTRFDAVIANPPFSLKNWGRASWSEDPFGRADFGVPPEGYADLAFVTHMLMSAVVDTGRIAVVLPRGALFRGSSERDIREAVIEANAVEAVIGLAPNLFYNTTIPAAVLVCRPKSQPSEDHSTLFIDAGSRFTKGRNQNEMTSADVAAIVAAFRTGELAADDDIVLRSVPLAEIRANDYDLDLGRYVARDALTELDFETALATYLDTRAELRAAEDRLDERLEARPAW
jgi:type I restriction enzyme M protein